MQFIHIAEIPDIAADAFVVVFLASWFGAGFVDPLRAGLAVATVWPLAVLLAQRGRPWVTAAAIVVSVPGIWAAGEWEALLSVKDDFRIVIDEVAGYLAAIAVAGRIGWFPAAALGAVFLYLDRVKPWPIDQVEFIEGGLGVALDDLVVAIPLGVVWLLAKLAWRHGRARWPRGARR